jgi:TfoX/Sxy family transcriptional regulator of competence genes
MPTEIKPQFLEILQSRPLTSYKKMFGGVGGWVKEHFFAIQDSQGDIYLRFDEADRAELRQLPDTKAFMDMREYVRIPPAVLADPDQLDEWVERSYQYVVNLPPKAAKKGKK